MLQLTGASSLKTVPIANSSTVKVGATVVAVGNAGGAGGGPTSTRGSVMAVNQLVLLRATSSRARASD